MTDDVFHQHLAQWMDDLRSKQDTLKNVYGIGHFDRFDWDGDNCAIRFSNTGNEQMLIASVTEIGTYSLTSKTWMWAWANDSITEAARVKSAELKKLAKLTGNKVFSERFFNATEALAWEFAAIAVHHLGSIGCYRAPSNDLYIFVTIDDLRTERRKF